MPKDLLKKYLPNPDTIKDNKSLRFLGDVIHEPNLWHMNRHSVTKAIAIGFFWGCMPMPFQMVAAAFVAVWLNANLPLSVATVWFSNPITMPPIFYFEYLVGAWVLQMPPLGFEYELTWEWLSERLYTVGVPLYLGAVICGIIGGFASYFIVGWLWKRNVKKRWTERKARREQA
ncbi:ATP-binding protein [Oleiphilus sp. HI0009]|nr:MULTISPECIES: DUF2062 domain-containing protein [unclassified Oleiphilus]KZX82332.1 ATP-binding protein [Oleiphilus sp. HI0009]MCH2157183.1 DUF2062 domain-containing protein [Oleiphilaceae bacterium]KZY68781.1 ATP-binding protein [Oleiphilus sp. HI0067]KZY71460.1 ATP-binding protein [Oleiphilus sp. HI0066]KZZ59445.1 ATP-binding protein [Oleiphilus sp. HI0125]